MEEERAREQAELQQKQISASNTQSIKDANEKMNRSSSLRKEFQSLPLVKNFDEVNASFEKVKSSAENPTPASDIALITGFMKMNDPGSTVREGEFKTAADAGSANQKFWNLYQSIKTGERLTPEQRQYFVDSSYRLYKAHANQYQRVLDQYTGLAEGYGLDPSKTFIQRNIAEYQMPENMSNQPSPQINNQTVETIARTYSPEQIKQMIIEKQKQGDM